MEKLFSQVLATFAVGFTAIGGLLAVEEDLTMRRALLIVSFGLAVTSLFAAILIAVMSIPPKDDDIPTLD